jgi:hypothetical protein
LQPEKRFILEPFPWFNYPGRQQGAEMDDRKEKQFFQDLGKLLIDFANTRSTDMAYIRYLENLQQVFSLSEEFLEKAVTFFPNLTSFIKELSETEKQLIDCMLSGPARQYAGRLSFGDKDEESVIRLGEELNKISPCYENIQNIENILNLLGKYRYAKRFSRDISKLQKYVEDTFEDIVNGKRLDETNLFYKFLSNKNSDFAPRKYVIEEDGKLVELPPADEKLYTQIEIFSYSFFVAMKNDLTFCLIEFFKFDNSTKLLGKCLKCSLFFISKKLRDQKYCSAKCRLAVSNENRIKSGEHAKYKREKRRTGAKESYHG